MKVFHLISGIKRRRGGHGDNVGRIRDILKRLDSYDDILTDESGKYTNPEKLLLWRATQFIKTGKIKDLVNDGD